MTSTTPIDTDPLEAILHKHITYSEGFDAYIVDDIDALRSDLATFEQKARVSELEWVKSRSAKHAGIWIDSNGNEVDDRIASLTTNGDKS